MKTKKSNQCKTLPYRQDGMVLIVGLIMVLLLSIISMAAMRGSGLQESMAGNMRDKILSFQAADSALRECEALLIPGAVPPLATCAAASGSCPDLNLNAATAITNSQAWLAFARTPNLALVDVVSQPQCLIEEMAVNSSALAGKLSAAIGTKAMTTGMHPKIYRVTGNGSGATAGTIAVTQSSYQRLILE